MTRYELIARDPDLGTIVRAVDDEGNVTVGASGPVAEDEPDERFDDLEHAETRPPEKGERGGVPRVEG